MKEESISARSGKKISVSARNGILVRTSSRGIALDPKRASSCDYTFVSHAHIDHVHSPNGKSKIIASKETAVLAKMRGYDLGETEEEAPGMDLCDAGHILGSRGILIEDSVFYTGDFSRRDRGFLKGNPGVKCDTLIMETTYGRPHYAFSETEKIVKEVNKLIAECFDNCRPVVMTGYPLGKAQLISYLFDNWDPVYLHESVFKMNSAHRHLGIQLKEFRSYEFKQSSSDGESPLERKPWVMIAPSSSGRSSLIRTLREKYDAVIVGFTGWAIDQKYKYAMGLDYAFDVSDHCDFNELVALAKYCDPSKIYTVHGFAEEFAEYLRSIGFDAEPLEGKSAEQSRISNYA